MLSTDRLTSALRERKKALVYVGTALALAGAGSATIAGGSQTAASAKAAVTVARHHAAPARPRAGSTSSTPAGQSAASHRAAPARLPSRKQAQVKQARFDRWIKVQQYLNAQTNPVAAKHGEMPKADRLIPVGTSGPQEFMPMTAARLSNATTIVRETLAKRMGLRSAVVAVATSMQESGLLNLHYGDSDSLGLFQQRPSCGWGSAAQITNPAFAARAFLGALHAHQASDSTWAAQPLWSTAQSVQNSGFPYAYAKWESQAAHLVSEISTKLVKSHP